MLRKLFFILLAFVFLAALSFVVAKAGPESEWVASLIVISFVCGAAAAALSDAFPVSGFFIGALLGPLGVLLAWALAWQARSQERPEPRMTPPPLPPPVPLKSMAERLYEIEELHARGLITSEERMAARERILGG